MEPSLADVRAIAQSCDCKRIPVKIELYSDCITPVEAMRALRSASNHCFMLESAEESQSWGRYTFLGFNPSMEITCADGLLRVRENVEGDHQVVKELEVKHPGDFLREVIAAHKTPAMEDFPPFTGGLVGYFSYDYIKYAEPSLRRDDLRHDEFLDMDLMLFDQLIVFDNYKQKIILIAGVYVDDIDASYHEAQEKLERMKEVLFSGRRYDFKPLELLEEMDTYFSKEEYCGMVEAARRHIYEGDIFQVVLSNPMEAKASGSLFDAYRVLRTTNPSPYMFYFTSDDVEISGASPETLVKLNDGRLFTYPLAGTRPRGATADEDESLEADLLADEKELAEHNMLVDLGRNDLGRIAKIGTVDVIDYMQVLKFSRVMHLGSTIEAQIADGKDAVDAIDSILPAGTLSGAPKLMACKIIQDLEGSKRGIYGGAIGYLDFSGNLDVCIAIRLAYKKNGVVCVQTGAGIVYDSIPESEFLECRNKARAVLEALRESEGGIA